MKKGTFQVYLAAPWFTPEQEERHDEVLRTLDQVTKNVFSPKRVFVCPHDADAYVRRETFEGNIKAIRTSDLVVSITDGRDLGTLWEMGYAYARGVPVIACAFTLGDRPFNLMLAEACAVVCRDIQELWKVLREYAETGRLPVRSYEGSIE